MDRGAYFSLDPADQLTLRTTISFAGGVLALVRDLTSTSIQFTRDFQKILQKLKAP